MNNFRYESLYSLRFLLARFMISGYPSFPVSIHEMDAGIKPMIERSGIMGNDKDSMNP